MLSDEYMLWGWPGTLSQYSTKYDAYIQVKEVKGEVIQFAIDDNQLIVLTDASIWHLLKPHTSVKAYDSLDGLTNDNTININSLHFVKSRPWFYLRGKHIILIVYLTAISFFTFLFFGKRQCPKRNK